MNFDDPEVVKEMLDTKELEKKWKEVYGFDFAHLGFDGSEVNINSIIKVEG